MSGFPWVIVGGTGYDVEEVDSPQTRDMVCPSCDKPVRFVEKELVKNLRVFGLPLVGIEKGRRVFECPRCKACIEPPAGSAPAAAGAAGPEATAEALRASEARLDRARFEVELWRRRVELATQHRDAALREEAERRLEQARAEVASVEAEIARLLGVGAPTEPAAAPPQPPQPRVVARPGGGPVAEDDTEREFAALRERLRRKQSEEASSAPPAPTPDVTDVTDVTENVTTPVPPEAVAQAPAADDDAAIEDEFAALKRRFSERGAGQVAREGGETPEAYEALRRELSEAPAPADGAAETGPPAAPPTRATEAERTADPAAPTGGADDGDDDPVAALKRRLRRPRG